MSRFLLLVLVACSGYTPSSTSSADGQPGGDVPADASTACANPADPFAVAELQSGVGYLASDELGGRSSGTPGDMATRAFIENAFRCAGLTPGGTDGYQQAFVAPDGTAAANLIGYLGGDGPAIIIGAHHDHLGTKNNQIYNGANDNASGVIALIAVARALAAEHPTRTIGFIAFGYEEHVGNCEGSNYYAAHPTAALANVDYMVNLDMVGTYALANELTVYGAATGTRGRTVLDGLAPSYSELDFTHAGNADEDDSDFQAFADHHVPYVYFETWDDACYHKPCDDADRVDYASMSQIAHLAKDLVTGL